MQLRGVVVLFGSLVMTTTAWAAGPTARRPIQADTLTALPAASVTKPLRVQRELRWAGPPSAAWRTFAQTGTWYAAWDRATGVPSRIWGSGISAPGAIASPAAAERHARAALAAHIALLAPGASPEDFVLVSNQLDGDMRSVGFRQRHAGRYVVGGQISFRFKRDRLFVIGSEALPDIALPAQPRSRLAREAQHRRAASALRQIVELADAPVSAPGDEVVLPLVAADGVMGYRVAVPITIDGGAEGRYLAYSDPASGEVLAVHQMNLYETSTGTVLYHAVDRYPAADRPRVDQPAPRAIIKLGADDQTTSSAGQVTWGDGGARLVTTSVVGDLVAVFNKASSGTAARAQLLLQPSNQIIWDASAVVEDDAQVQTFLAVNRAKEFAGVLDAGMKTLGDQITANVNIAADCNAYFDGTAVNFFRASTRCQNTGLIQDVVFHEFGHAVHMAEVITGVGAFDGAMSEGAADFFAAQITGDPGMGRGFFYSEQALRDLDPPDSENRWPDDIGEIHKTGIIFGGAFWDLRKNLIQLLGQAEGIQLTQRLFVAALRRSTSIPTSLIEVLAADDDDADLSNGTPHECAIRSAYGQHGLRTATGTIHAADRLSDAAVSSTPARVTVTGLSGCPSDQLDRVDLSWQPSGGAAPVAGGVTALPSGPSEFVADLPVAPDATLLYQARVVFKDGSVLTLPDNLADPYYQLYDGQTVSLYCTDFESSDPMTAGWTTGAGDSSASPWAWGAPSGSGSGRTDPTAAFSGQRALIQALGGNYTAKSSSYVRMPPIDVGQWSDVHLQYRRWLAVEDSHFDQARVTVGGKQAWVNFTQNAGDSSSTHHIDREWRFHDVPVSGYQIGHVLDIAWDLTSDEGLQFGGWALDDVCVVANVRGVCGDGVVTAREACDDGPGNADAPNVCRTYCQKPACGDAIVDDGEQCDHGGGDSVCTAKCELVGPPELGGCCSAGRGGAGGPLVLGAAVLGFVVRRRRRSTR